MADAKHKNFFSRFNKIISLVYGVITISAAALFSLLYNDNYEANIQTINLRLLEQTQAFNNILRIRYDAVKAMQRQARKFLKHEFTMFDAQVHLKDVPAKNIYFLAVRSGEDNPYGMIIGKGSTKDLDKDQWHELQMAFSLTPLVHVLKNQIQTVIAFHYISANNFYYRYPWNEYTDLSFDEKVYEREYYLRSLPEHNREDKVFWTDVSLCPINNQPRVTCAAPVYKDLEYKGVVGVDFNLDSVDFFIESIYHKQGQFLIINDRGTVLSHMGLDEEHIHVETERINDLLPKDLAYHYIEKIEDATLTRVGNYWVFAANTAFAPWKIVYYVTNYEITFQTLKHILPSLLLVIVFTTLFLIGANRLIASEFIEPANLLVDHISNQGKNLTDSLEKIQQPWAHWFSAISKVFDENRELVSKLERHILKLDEKVSQRTKDLSQKNKQLENALEDLKKAQSKIITQEKLAGLGALTAGIAHEIRNPLNFIINFAETSKIFGQEIASLLENVESKIDESERETLCDLSKQLLKNMYKIEEHGKRADAIVHSMLTHARSGEDDLREINLHELIDENILLGLASFKQRGFVPKVRKYYDDSLDKAVVYPQDLGRVFLNLINNACYVLFEKSKKNLEGYMPQLTVSTINEAEHVIIKIRDNGLGITPAVRKKIFDPFFTTKPSGEGTGLGLSIGFDIVVNQHHGEMLIDTEMGKYTEFTLIIPKIITPDYKKLQSE